MLRLINFCADWSAGSRHTTELLGELGARFPEYKIENVHADEDQLLAGEFNVTSVPTLVVTRGNAEIDRIEGANPPKLVQMLQKHRHAGVTPNDTRIEALVNSARVVLFIKGTPQHPRCKFTKQLLALVTCKFASFNVLEDDEIRQQLKVYSDWPTFPQVYIDGKFIGGVDIVKELVESGEFAALVPPEEPLDARLAQLINSAPVMIFIKGSPVAPKCGFSAQLVGLLKEKNVAFAHFDILEDEDVRQGLKTYSNWPTYPQVYVKGELIGGLDIVREMVEDGYDFV